MQNHLSDKLCNLLTLPARIGGLGPGGCLGGWEGDYCKRRLACDKKLRV